MNKDHGNRAGVIVVVVAVAFPFLLGFLALALDIGYIYHAKRRIQAAADAGAMAGAVEIYRRHPDYWASAATNDVKLNGYEAGATITVEVNCPPTRGPRALGTPCANSGFVEVIVTEQKPLFFMRIANWESTGVQARAVAGAVPFNGHPCIIALNPTAEAALFVPGSSTLNADCGVMVNSTHNNAISQSGDACIFATEVGVTGSFTMQGSGQCITPLPVDNVPPILDPLGHLEPPPMPAGAIETNLVIQGTGTYDLQPGRYQGGIDISGDNTLTINFAPGIYYLDGAGLQAAGSPTLSGTELMFYNSLTPAVASGKFGAINIGGEVNIQLHSMTSGYYEGVLFFNDRSAPTPTGADVRYEIRGSANSVYDGALYFSSVPIDLQGQASTNSPWTFLIADMITVRGAYIAKSTVGGGFASTPPLMKPTLVE